MEIKSNDFACRCGEKSSARCDEVMEEVVSILKPDEEFGLLSQVVYGLEWNFKQDVVARIEGIGCDQWCAVSSSAMKYNEEKGKYEELDSAFIQCDRVEDGIAFTYKYYHDKYYVPGS